ncbi:MAG: PBP1A family penicillin-binding protein [Pseudomonadota bacterium]
MIRFLRFALFVIGLAGAAGIAVTGGVLGGYFYESPNLPPAETIRDIPLKVPLRVYTRDGKLIAEIGEERRTPVDFDELPDLVVHALLAAEDDRFFAHPGVDYQGLLRAAYKFALSGRRAQGGSTITMQLARDYYLNRDRRFVRKIREIFLAWRIEQEFSKEDILAMFLNKMFFGQRAYGVAAAAQVYFDKTLDELNAAEAATIVGTLAAPSRYNPVSGPDNARSRRGYVLRRMRELNYLTDAEYDEAMDYPLESELHGPDVEVYAPYLAEMVRLKMLERFGDTIYSAGYRVYTTVDSKLQTAANYALENGLLEYDRRHGFRGPLATLADVSAPSDALTSAEQQALRDHPEYGPLQVALVRAVGEKTATVTLRDESTRTLEFAGLSWAREYIDDDTRGPEIEAATDILAAGDIVYVIPTVTGDIALAQLPIVQGAVVALDPNDGAVAALEGGFDYRASKFNRAVQIKRQPGSTFKPFIYSAALEQGMTAATIINDSPVVLESDELEKDYRPINYGGRFHGPTPLREALYRSFNLVSVRILLRIGLGNAIRHLRQFGFDGDETPRDTSLALGSGAMSPLKLATGYAVFANTGYKVEPYFIDRIVDTTGAVLERAKPLVVCEICQVDEEAPEDAAPVLTPAMATATSIESYRPDANEAPELFAGTNLAERVLEIRNAWLISDIMRDVIRRGTGVRANALGRTDLSGKTGTSNDRRDAWFAGFNRDLVATVWVGFDADRPLGGREEGSRTALPIWMRFIELVMNGVPNHMAPQPSGMTTVRISRETGELPRPGDVNIVFETFRDEYAPRPDFADPTAPLGGDPFNTDELADSAEDPLF